LSPDEIDEILEASTERCRAMDVPLNARLDAFADVMARYCPDFTDTLEHMLRRLYAAGAGDASPQLGNVLPPFVLPDEEGHLVALEELLQHGQVVIAFHRGHWCPYCRLNADALSRVQSDIKAAGASLVLISPETQKFSCELKADAKGNFPVLTDLDSGYALELKLALMITGDMRRAMIEAGWDIAPFQDNDNWTLPIPATFVVGPDGVIKGRFVDPDYRKRMDIDELLKAVRS
jgi:peroxiredoxin